MLNITVSDSTDFACTDVLFQTALWGKIKEKTLNTPSRYFWVHYSNKDNDDEIKLDFPLYLQIRTTKAGTTYAYGPKAPAVIVPESEKSRLLEELGNGLKEYLPKETEFVRFDLPWGIPGVGSPTTRSEICEIAMNYGTKLHNLKKAPSNHLCPDTVIVDLKYPPEKLFEQMRQQTRNSVRRSYREGIEFNIYDENSPDLMEVLSQWHEIYTNTGSRKGFYFESLDYFKTIFDCVKNHKEKPKYEKSSGVPLDAEVPQPEFYLFTAGKDGKLLSGLILAISGKRAYYMYAASSLEHRELMPNYGLQWEVIRFARSKGCNQYDLMGIPPNSESSNPMAGLYIFKTGFGGRKVHYGGTWDFPYDEEKYKSFRVSEALQLR